MMLQFIFYVIWFTLWYLIGIKVAENILDELFERKRKMGRLTEQEIEKIIANSNATLEVEGMKPSEESNEITKRYLRGELTSIQAIQKILDLKGVK